MGNDKASVRSSVTSMMILIEHSQIGRRCVGGQTKCSIPRFRAVSNKLDGVAVRDHPEIKPASKSKLKGNPPIRIVRVAGGGPVPDTQNAQGRRSLRRRCRDGR